MEFLRFGNPNFQLFIWELNGPESLNEQVDRMVEAAQLLRAQGVVLDLEGSFNGKGDEAVELYTKMREKVRQFGQQDGGWPLTLGVTVIGFCPNATFLNATHPILGKSIIDLMLEDADFVMPQVYNKLDNFSDREFRGRINFWDRLGRGQRFSGEQRRQHSRSDICFGADVVPAESSEHTVPIVFLAGAHHCDADRGEAQCGGERPKTAEEFEHCTGFFRTETRSAIGWWRYGSVARGDLWAQIRDFPVSP